MSKKIVIVVGTRPNFIKITQFDKEFKKHGNHFEFKLVHTGQHYDKNMSKVFFEQFKLKEPDIYLNVKAMTPAQQIAMIIEQLSEFFGEYQPDLVIVVGDVNSTLAAAIAANKSGIKVAHLESGLRSRDKAMPEEVNRIMTDAITQEFFVTEQSGLDNLAHELDDDKGVHFVGNTMIDTLVAFDEQIQQSSVLEDLKVKAGNYALMTMHRPRNVDTKEALLKFIRIIDSITGFMPLVFPIHPRTKNRLETHGLLDKLTDNPKVVMTGPLDYLSFQKLIANAKFVITDSGGIQEETTFRQVPCLTLRENTERPSTITLGTNELVPFDPDYIHSKIEAINNGTYKQGEIPPLWDGKATARIVETLKDIL